MNKQGGRGRDRMPGSVARKRANAASQPKAIEAARSSHALNGPTTWTAAARAQQAEAKHLAAKFTPEAVQKLISIARGERQGLWPGEAPNIGDMLRALDMLLSRGGVPARTEVEAELSASSGPLVKVVMGASEEAA